MNLHLNLRELVLHPSGEWLPDSRGWVLLRVAAGAGYFFKKGIAGELNSGDGLVLGFHEGIQLRASLLETMNVQFFTVQPEHLDLLAVEEWLQFRAMLKNPPKHFLLFRAEDSIGRKFARLVQQSAGNHWLTRFLLLEFWAETVAEMVAAPKFSAPSSRLRQQFHQFFAQMSVAELSACSLPELTRRLNCSERHFHRLFREEFGVSFQTHRTETRLLRAKQLLAESDAPVVEIASRLDYRHISFFNRMFKKHFGVTPSQWRLQAKNGRTANVAGPENRSRPAPELTVHRQFSPG